MNDNKIRMETTSERQEQKNLTKMKRNALLHHRYISSGYYYYKRKHF
mgnify:CR=1 FL=1